MRYVIANPQPSYLRLGKAGESNIHTRIPNIKPGEWLNVVNTDFNIEGENPVILTTGATLASAYEMVKNSPKLSLRSLPLWGMKYKASQVQNFKNCSTVTVYEDHLVDGGFGSWLLESIHESGLDCGKLVIKGIDSSVCGMVGSQQALHKICGPKFKENS